MNIFARTSAFPLFPKFSLHEHRMHSFEPPRRRRETHQALSRRPSWRVLRWDAHLMSGVREPVTSLTKYTAPRIPAQALPPPVVSTAYLRLGVPQISRIRTMHRPSRHSYTTHSTLRRRISHTCIRLTRQSRGYRMQPPDRQCSAESCASPSQPPPDGFFRFTQQ